MNYFKQIFTASAAIIRGLSITLKTMFLPSATVNYPVAKLKPYDRFRGALLFDQVVCIGCNLCVKACPSTCISLKNSSTPEGKRIAKVDWYTIDFGKCNFCKLCEEACPTKPKSVWHSLDYETVFYNRNEMVRVWQKEEPWIGSYWNAKTNQYMAPEGQIPIEETPVRR